MLPSKVNKAQSTIAKLEARQMKLNAARDKAAKELADAIRHETVQSGRAEFIQAVEALDFSAREVVVSTVLHSLKDESRLARIQAWTATIPKCILHSDPTRQCDQAGAKGETEPTSAVNQSENVPAKPESSVSDPPPTQ